MFTSFDLIVSYPVPVRERKEYDYLLAAYSATPQGQWLNDMAWRGFEFKYCQKMAESSVMGAFVVSAPRTIYIMPSNTDDFNFPIPAVRRSPIAAGRTGWSEIIVPTVIHELRHAWQYRRCKWLYVICCLPGLRQLTLERDAWKITRKAEKIFEKFNANRTAREFEEHMK